jgi:hypothetical protein
MQNLNIINLVGEVQDPTSTSQPDGNTPACKAGRQGEQLASEIHGKLYTANYRGLSVRPQCDRGTIPVIASAWWPVFALQSGEQRHQR